MAECVHRCADEHRPRPNAALVRSRWTICTTATFAHEREQFFDINARGNFFQRSETHDAIAIDYECRGESDATFFSTIEQAVRGDDLALRVA